MVSHTRSTSSYYVLAVTVINKFAMLLHPVLGHIWCINMFLGCDTNKFVIMPHRVLGHIWFICTRFRVSLCIWSLHTEAGLYRRTGAGWLGNVFGFVEHLTYFQTEKSTDDYAIVC